MGGPVFGLPIVAGGACIGVVTSPRLSHVGLNKLTNQEKLIIRSLSNRSEGGGNKLILLRRTCVSRFI